MESKLWVRTNDRMEIERKRKPFKKRLKYKYNGGYIMKKFVSKFLLAFLVVVTVASMMQQCFLQQVAEKHLCPKRMPPCAGLGQHLLLLPPS